MGKFRKKPIVIEAEKFQLLGDLRPGDMFMLWPIKEDERGIHLIIPTLEGDHRADLGDVIIKGVKGEYYPCKPDIFEATYGDYEDVTGLPARLEMPVPLNREGLEFLFKYPPEARKEELERCSKEYLLQFIELARGEWARVLEHIAGGCKGQLYKPLAFGGASEQMRRVDDSLTDGFTQHYLDIYAGSDGAGGAPHLYQVVKKNALDGEGPLLTIQLQHGNPEEVGVNGIGTETLLFIGLDFLTKCLAGPYTSAETEQVVSHLRQAFEWVKKREEDRKARGVYQKHQA